MFASMYFPEVDELNDEERQCVEDNVRLVWKAYHSWKRLVLSGVYDKDDIFSIGVLALIKAVKTHTPEKGAISTWATILINNQYRNLYRYCERRSSVLQCQELVDDMYYDECPEHIDDIVEQVYIKQLMKQAGLNSVESDVLDLCVGRELLQREAADRLDIPLSRISRIKTRALRKLQQMADIGA